MKWTSWSLKRGVGLVLVCALCAASAAAFFPIGGTSTDSGQLLFAGWALEDMDGDGNGRISGDEDGIEITIEGGEFGFTAPERLIIQEGFAVWENVNTSFAKFRFTLPITDPIPASVASGVNDGINFVALQVEGDPSNDPVVFPALAVTWMDFLIDDETRTDPSGEQQTITGGRTIEAEIIFDEASFRSTVDGVPPAADLLGVTVHEVGHFLGFDHNPMSNLVPDAVTGVLVESAIFAQRDSANRLVSVGVTPTMFFQIFLVDDGTGLPINGNRTLAPDDIAALTWRYPSGNIDANFFTITQQAMTQMSSTVISQPLLGGLVTAWCDVDNNPATPRVPFLSTMTGLMQPNVDIDTRGTFDLIGLPKVIESIGAAPFEATYTMTLEPISDFRFPLLGAGTDVAGAAAAADSTHQGEFAWPVAHDAAFPSEVFHEDGAIFGSENRDAGSVIAFDQSSGQIIIKTVQARERLSQILRGGRTMFGDSDFKSGCSAGVVQGSNAPKPSAGRIAGDSAVLGITIALLWFAGMWRRRSARGIGGRGRAFGAALAALLAVGLSAAQTHAAIAFVTEEELVRLADDIIQGTVTSVENVLGGSRFGVKTAVGFRIDDTMKGRLNKQSQVFVDIPMGRKGNIITYAPELPKFNEGDEVILFLKFNKSSGFLVLGGIRGKHLIGPDPAKDEPSGNKDEDYIVGMSGISKIALELVTKSVVKAKGLDPRDAEIQGSLKLGDYKEHIRRTVKAQSRQ